MTAEVTRRRDRGLTQAGYGRLLGKRKSDQRERLEAVSHLMHGTVYALIRHGQTCNASQRRPYFCAPCRLSIGCGAIGTTSGVAMRDIVHQSEQHVLAPSSHVTKATLSVPPAAAA